MDSQDRPAQDAPDRSKQESDDRAQLSLGIVFFCVGVGLMVGPGAAGVPFLAIGLVFLSAAGTRRLRR